MAERGCFLVPTLVTYDRIAESGKAGGAWSAEEEAEFGV
jgi:hypothetical protein